MHCLLLPVALMALPHAGPLGGLAEVAHLLFAVLLLPVTIQALRARCPQHALRSPAARWLLGVGLGCVWMAVPAHALFGHGAETGLTVAGSLLLIGGHGVRRWPPARPDRARVASSGASRSVLLRPLTPTDAPRMARCLARLSDHVRGLRFGSMQPHRNTALLDYLCAVDGRNHVAWGAFHRGELVGVCRYVRLDEEPAAAEVAAFVLDAYQQRGIGRRLLRATVATARRQGIHTFVCHILPHNRAVLDVVKRWSTRLDVRDGLVRIRVATARLRQALAPGRRPTLGHRTSATC